MLYWLAKRMREMQEVKRDERGFTLIELLIVIIIIGILAAIALPTFLAQRDKANAAKCKSDTRNAAEAAILYSAGNDDNNNTFEGATMALLEDEGFNQSPGIDTSIEGGEPVGPPGDEITLRSDCPDGVGDATWSTEGSFPGVVTGGDVSP